MDWTEIIIAGIGLVGTILTTALIPLIRSKLSAEKLAMLDYWLRVLIAAAETEIDGESMGEQKKAWVLNKLSEMGLNFEQTVVSEAIDGICRDLTAKSVIN